VDYCEEVNVTTIVEPDQVLRAEALFASAVQESERPSPGRVRAAVADALERLHPDGLAAVLAQEAGDHPELYEHRMQWALRTVAEVYAPASTSLRRAA
jgi:hypothetical protein